jgi:DNA polymerase-3 subunit epsilon
LLDAEILADIYLAMTGGQVVLSLELKESQHASRQEDGQALPRSRPSNLVTLLPTAEELQAHAARLAVIDKASGGRCAWKRLYEPSEESDTLH